MRTRSYFYRSPLRVASSFLRVVFFLLSVSILFPSGCSRGSVQGMQGEPGSRGDGQETRPDGSKIAEEVDSAWAAPAPEIQEHIRRQRRGEPEDEGFEKEERVRELRAILARVGMSDDPDLLREVVRDEGALPASRALALKFLAATNAQDAVEIARSSLSDEDESLRRVAVRVVLSSSGPDSADIQRVVAVLASTTSEAEKIQISHELARAKSAEGGEVLYRNAEVGDAITRTDCFFSLRYLYLHQKLTDEKKFLLLIEKILLTDSSSKVRGAVLSSLSELLLFESIPREPTVNILERYRATETDEDNLDTVDHLLRRFGRPPPNP